MVGYLAFIHIKHQISVESYLKLPLLKLPRDSVQDIVGLWSGVKPPRLPIDFYASCIDNSVGL